MHQSLTFLRFLKTISVETNGRIRIRVPVIDSKHVKQHLHTFLCRKLCRGGHAIAIRTFRKRPRAISAILEPQITNTNATADYQPTTPSPPVLRRRSIFSGSGFFRRLRLRLQLP